MSVCVCLCVCMCMCVCVYACTDNTWDLFMTFLVYKLIPPQVVLESKLSASIMFHQSKFKYQQYSVQDSFKILCSSLEEKDSRRSEAHLSTGS